MLTMLTIGGAMKASWRTRRIIKRLKGYMEVVRTVISYLAMLDMSSTGRIAVGRREDSPIVDVSTTLLKVLVRTYLVKDVVKGDSYPKNVGEP